MSQPNTDILELFDVLPNIGQVPTLPILVTEEQMQVIRAKIQELYVLKSDVEEQSDSVVREQLVLFGAELAYCLANHFPIGEGHTPPSMTYESMEGKVDKWVESRQKIATKLNLNTRED